jgi:serine/threonine protein kinase
MAPSRTTAGRRSRLTVPKAGDVLGRWELRRRLGFGGNAVVWLALGSDGSTCALKILTAIEHRSDSYERFRKEVRALQLVRNFDGVLPLLEANLPESPTAADRPWLAMPVATIVLSALRGATLPEVVGAVASFARTLERLRAEHGIAHRDIKPQNLYRLDDRYVVGDFGLVSLPDSAPLTTNDRPLGPRFFMPYEMIATPMTADAHRADVFSLGKTLWVLAVEQNYPPPGHIRADQIRFRLSDFRASPLAQRLDAIIDRATREQPSARSTMAGFARELEDLLTEPSAFDPPDVEQLSSSLRRILQPAMDEEDLQRRRINAALQAWTKLSAALVMANRRLEAITSTARFGVPSLFSRGLLPVATLTYAPAVWSDSSSSVIPGDHELRVGWAVELRPDGFLVLRAGITVGAHEGTLSTPAFLWLMEPRSVEVESTSVERAITETANAVESQLKQALGRFLDLYDASGDRP